MATFNEWDRLIALNGGEKILYVEPSLDEGDETWFTSTSNRLHVASRGQLLKGLVPLPASPPTRRELLHQARRDLFVEFLEYPEGAFATLAHNNGSLVIVRLEAAQLEAWRAHYRKLGFRPVGNWHLNPAKLVVREYRGELDGTHTCRVVSVDGDVVTVSGRPPTVTKCATRADAERLAEQQCADLLSKGLSLHLMEEASARHENPPEVSPVALPVLSSYPAPRNAREAVDVAVARLTELHRVFPRAHLIVELLSLPQDTQRVGTVVRDVDFFCDMHADRVGRWLNPGAAPTEGSSYDYFVAKYGTLTWAFDSTPEHEAKELKCFYCGNVSGGGWSPLEVRDGEYDTSDLGELSCLKVFHGGWHHGLSYAFDTRVTDARGEHPIVRFDECDEDSLDEPGEVTAFGDWLLRRVEKLSEVAIPWLASMQD